MWMQYTKKPRQKQGHGKELTWKGKRDSRWRRQQLGDGEVLTQRRQRQRELGELSEEGCPQLWNFGVPQGMGWNGLDSGVGGNVPSWAFPFTSSPTPTSVSQLSPPTWQG